MKFELNGEVIETQEPLDVSSLLDRYELRRQRVAVAINTEVVPRSRFAEVAIQEGDRVEVIHAVGGG